MMLWNIINIFLCNFGFFFHIILFMKLIMKRIYCQVDDTTQEIKNNVYWCLRHSYCIGLKMFALLSLSQVKLNDSFLVMNYRTSCHEYF